MSFSSQNNDYLQIREISKYPRPVQGQGYIRVKQIFVYCCSLDIIDTINGVYRAKQYMSICVAAKFRGLRKCCPRVKKVVWSALVSHDFYLSQHSFSIRFLGQTTACTSYQTYTLFKSNFSLTLRSCSFDVFCRRYRFERNFFRCR
jgi:hypothetical protein